MNNSHRRAAIAVLACTSLATAITSTKADTITWNGAAGTPNWDTSSASWTGDDTVYTDGDIVHFGSAGVTAVSIQSAGVLPASVTFDSNTQAYSFSNQSSGVVGINGTGTLTKNGSATVTFNSPMTYSGGTTINAGTLAVVGDDVTTGGRIQNTVVTVNRGAKLALDRYNGGTSNSVVTFDRYGNLNDLALRGGTLAFGSTAVTATTGVAHIENIGTLRFSGDSTYSALRYPDAGQTRVALEADAFQRENRGTLLFGVNQNTNSNKFVNFANDSSQRYYITANNLLGPASLNGMVSPYFLATYDGGSSIGFVNYAPGTNGGGVISDRETFFAVVGTMTNLYPVMPVTGLGTEIVDVTASTPINDTRNIYALRTSADISGTGTLQINSGGLVVHQSTAANRSITTHLNFNTAEAVVYNNNGVGFATTLSGNITAGDGFTKSGPGTLILTGTNNFGANKQLTINQGTLRIGSAAGAGSVNTGLVRIVDGATLDGNGTGSTFGTLAFNLNENTNTFDLITVLGTFDITKLAIDFNITGTLDAASYLIADYSSASGILIGSQFASITDFPNAYLLDYVTGDQIRLVAKVPEPASGILIIFALAGFGRFARRRGSR